MILVWKSFVVPEEYKQYSDRIMTQADFIKFDLTDSLMDKLASRMKAQKPGHCMSLV